MKGRTNVAVVAFLLGTSIAATTQAAENSNFPNAPVQFDKLPFIEKNQIRTTGKNVRMSSQLRFALGTMMGQSATRLSAADRSSMQEFYRTEPDFTKSKSTLTEMCLELKQQSEQGAIDPYALARYLERSEDEANQAQLTYYERQVSLLSKPARQAFDEALSAIDDKNLSSTRTDYFGLATDAPEFLVNQLQKNCPNILAAPKRRENGGFIALPPSASPNR